MMQVKVNVGCGPQVVADWINYDSSLHVLLSKYHFIKKLLSSLRLISKQVCEISWPSELIKRVDVRKGLPLVDETVDFIYTSHFIEHLTKTEGLRLFRECYRVLKPGGWIRIVCPDLKLITRRYLEGNLNYVLFQVKHKADLSRAFITSLGLTDNRPFVERIFFPGSLHRSMYDYYSLASLLTESGFSICKRRRYREGITPDIDLLDNRPEESLYVEAQKS
jgi:SAM-dependent methyltransferase